VAVVASPDFCVFFFGSGEMRCLLLAEFWRLHSALGCDASCSRVRFGVAVCAGFRRELLLAPSFAALAFS